MNDSTRDRIANIGVGMIPTYHATESVEEARAVVEQCRSATEELRRLLDERGVEWREGSPNKTKWTVDGIEFVATNAWPRNDETRTKLVMHATYPTPEQAVEATLGRIPQPNQTWVKWLESLRHNDDDIKTIGDAVEQLMYESIQFGGDMGPNGNVYQGIDEGDVLTSGFINSWIERFESTLGRNKYSYEQWRKVSYAIGDAMEYAHDKAIEYPDKADPLWNLDEYVNRVLDIAFNGPAMLEPVTCKQEEHGWSTEGDHARVWLTCGHDCMVETVADLPNFCPTCGAKVIVE